MEILLKRGTPLLLGLKFCQWKFCQIPFLLNIPVEGVGFDVMTDIYKGEMVSLNQIPDDDDLEGEVAFGANNQEAEHGTFMLHSSSLPSMGKVPPNWSCIIFPYLLAFTCLPPYQIPFKEASWINLCVISLSNQPFLNIIPYNCCFSPFWEGIEFVPRVARC